MTTTCEKCGGAMYDFACTQCHEEYYIMLQCEGDDTDIDATFTDDFKALASQQKAEIESKRVG